MTAYPLPNPALSTKRHRARRKSLLLSCALGSGLVLATCPGTAMAQAVPNAAPQTRAGFVTYSRDSAPTPGTETITVETPTAIIDWTPTTTPTGVFDFLPAGNILNFNVGGEQLTFAVLNRIITTVPSRFDGSVVSRARDVTGAVVPGGTVLFSSPGGIIIGSAASFDVGNLVLTTLNVVDDGQGNFIGPNGTFQLNNGAANPNAAIITEAGSSIVANGENSYLALVSPVINHAGSARVNGSVAYIAGEQVSFSVNQGLFDIVVGAGSDNAQPIVHTGSTGGPASTGVTGDNHGIYMVAVPKNQAVTMLLSGNVGFDAATNVNVVNGEIVLSAGYNVTAGEIGDDAGSTLDADITINGGTNGSSFSSNVTGRATHNAVAFADRDRPLTFSGSLALQGGNLASLEAGLQAMASVAGDLTLSAADLATGAPGTAQMQTSSGGSITVGGNATLSADAGFDSFADGNGASTRGGTAAINAFGIVSIAGDASLSATGTGERASAIGGNGGGGFASISAPGGAVFVGGAAELDAGGIGGNGFSASGNGRGGGAFVSASNFGSISVAGTLDIFAYGVGGSEFLCDNFACTASGGDGAGGNAFAGASGGGSLTAGALSLDASGGGADGFDAGGDGVGGTATLTGDGRIMVDSLGISSLGVGGDAVSDVGIGGSGTGGTASIVATAGANFTVDPEGAATGGIDIFAIGVGGAGRTGGSGAGGTALLSADRATIDVTRSLLMVAAGLGGADFDPNSGGYLPGSGTGGTASLLASNGSDVGVDVGIQMHAGGGTLILPAQDVNFPPAGAGVGGTIETRVTDSTLATTTLLAAAAGVGGGGSTAASGSGTSGFAGTGGNATFEFSNAGDSTLTTLAIDVRGSGGAGGSAVGPTAAAGGGGGAGQGGSATVRVAGGEPALGNFLIAAGGTGGRGGDGADNVLFNLPGGNGGAGGSGGSGTGGSAEIVAGVGGVVNLDTNILLVNGQGGVGGSGGEASEIPGVGGTGGNGLGGLVALRTTGGQIQVLNSDGISLQSRGIGGNGGAGGGNPLEGATGAAGGNAGNGTGGTAEADVVGGSITSPTGAAAIVDSNGLGGVGGAGGLAFNLGTAGTSGNGTGGFSRISIADGNGTLGSASLGFVTLRSNGIGGSGFTGLLDTAGRLAFDDSATGAVTLAGLTAEADGQASSAGPAFAFTSSGGPVQVTDDVFVDVNGDVTVDATGTGGLVAGGLLGIVTPGSITIDHQARGSNATLSGAAVQLGAGVDIFAGAGSLIAATVQDLLIQSPTVDVGALTAANNIQVNNSRFAQVNAVGSVFIDSAIAGADIDLNASTDIDVGVAQAGDDFIARAGGTFTGGTITTTGAVDNEVETPNGSNIGVFANGDLRLDNGQAPDIIFLQSSGGNILSGGTLRSASLTASAFGNIDLHDVFVTANLVLDTRAQVEGPAGGFIDANSLNSDGDIDLDAATTINVASVDAGGALTADAVGDIRIDNGVAGTGAIILTSTNGRILSSTLLQSGANIELNSFGDTIIASAAAGDDFLANAGGAFTASNVTAIVGSDIIVTSAGDLTLDNAEATGTIQLTSTGASILSSGLLDAGTSLQLSAANNIDMNDGNAGDFISLSAGAALDAGDLSAVGQIFASSSGSATIASATSGSSIFVFASGAADLGTFDAGGSLVVSGATIQFDSAVAADDVDLSAGGDISVTFAQAGDDFTANTDGAFTGGNVVTTGLGFDSETQPNESTFGGVGSNILIDAVADARLDNANTVGFLDINSVNGSVLSDGLLEAAGNFTVLAASNVDINDGISSGFMQVEAESGSLDAGDLSSVGSLLAFANTGATIASADAAGILVSTSGTADLGTLNSSLEIRVTADEILLASGTAADDVDLTASGDIAVTFAQAGDDFTATAGGAFTGGNVVTTGLGFDGETIGGVEGGSGGVGSNIIVHAENDLRLDNGDSAGFIELLSNAGAIASSTLLEAVDDVDLDSAGDTAITSAIAGNDFLADAGGAFTATDVTAGNNATVTSVGNLTLADADAGAAIQLTSTGGDVLSGGQLTAGSFLTISAANNIDINDADAAAFIDLFASNGSLDAGALTSDGTIFANATTDVTIASATSGDTIFVSSGGLADLGALVASGSIFVNGAAIQFVSGTADEDIDLTADGDIAVTFAQAGDDFVASAGGNFTGANVTTTGLGFDNDIFSEGPVSGGLGSNIVVDAVGDVRLDNGNAADALRLTSSGARILSNTSLAAGGNIEIDSFGDTLIAAAAAGNDFLADAGGAFTATNVTAANNVTVTSAGNLTLADADAGAAIQLTSTGGDVVSTGLLDAGTSLQVSAANNIDINNANGPAFIDLFASSGSLDANALTSDGTIFANAGTDVTIASATSGDTLFVSSGGVADLGTMVANGSIFVNGAAILLASGTAVDDVDLTASGDIAVTFAQAGDDFTATAGGAFTGGTVVTTGLGFDGETIGGVEGGSGGVGSNIIVHAENDLRLDNGGSAGFIELLSNAGAIASSTLLEAVGDVDLDSFGDTSIAAATAGDDFLSNAGGAFTATNVTAAGDVMVTAAGTLTLANADAGASIQLNSTNGNVLSTGVLNAGSFLTISAANNIDINAASGAAFVDLFASSGSLNVGALTSGGSIFATAGTDATIASATSGDTIFVLSGGLADLGTLSAAGSIVVSGAAIQLASGTADEDIDLTADGNIAVSFAQAGDDFVASAGGTFTGANVTTTGLGFDNDIFSEGPVSGGLGSNIVVDAAGDVRLDNGNAANALRLTSSGARILSSTSLAAGGNIELDSFGDTLISAATAGNDFLADAGGAFTATVVTAANAATVTSAGNLTLADADAGAAIQLTSTGGDVLSSGLLTAGSFLTISAANNIDINDADAAAFIDLFASNGSLDAGALTSGGTIFANATTDVTIASATSGDTIFVSTGGAADLGTFAANGSIFVNAASIKLDSATASDDVDLTADGDIGVTFAQAGDDFTATAGGTFTGATVVTTGLGFDGDLESSEGGFSDLIGSNIFVEAEGDLRLDNGDAADALRLTSNAGGISSSTSLAAGDNIELDSSGDTSIATATAGNDFLADAGGAFTATDVTASGDVIIDSAGTLALANGDAGDLLQLSSSAGSVTSSGTLRANRLDAEAAQDIALNDVAVVQDLSLSTPNGSITGNDFSSSDGDIILDAAQQIALASASGATVTSTAGGDLRVDSVNAPGAVELTSTGGNIVSDGSIQTGSSLTASAAGSGRFNEVQAASVDIDLGGSATFTGAVASPNIAVASSDIDIAAGASLGTAGTSLVSLTVQSSSGQTVLGGGTQGSGYSLNDAEADRIRAAHLVIEAPALGSAANRAPDLLIRDLSLSALRTGQVDILTSGIAQVEGELRLADAGAGNGILLQATQRLQIATPGAVRVQDASGMTDGSLEMRSNNIWSANAAVLDELSANPNFAGRDAALLVNDGPVNLRGSIEAGDVTLKVGETLFVQNSGSVLDFAGITVRENTLTVVPTGSQPIQAYAFGRRINPDGSFVTNNDFFREVAFVGRGTGYSNEAQFNLCFINSGACRLPSPNEPLPGGQDIVEEPIFNEEPTTTSDTGVLPPPGTDSDTLVDTSFGSDPLIEEPVTSGGDSSLWDGDCDRDDDGDCDLEDLR